MEKFDIYQQLSQRSTGRHMLFKHDELTGDELNTLTCSCCGLLLRDCLALKDGEQTQVLFVQDPNRFQNAPDGFLNKDDQGRTLYIPLCGTNTYEA